VNRPPAGVPALVPAGQARVPAQQLWAGLPEPFARTVFPVGEEPFASLFYRPASRSGVIDASALPPGFGYQLAWWLHSLFVLGERVPAAPLRFWIATVAEVNLQREQRGGPAAGSFLDLPAGEWLTAGRAAYARWHGELPPASYGHTYEPVLHRLHAALVARCEPAEWWRAEVWDPLHDRRIPQREHEPHRARVSFTDVPQRWLAEGMRWFLAVGLQTGAHVWSSLPGYRTQLGTYFAEYCVLRGIDTPVLCADPPAELRAVMLGYLDYLRSRPAIRPGRSPGLAAQTVGSSQAILARFYGFMLDHQAEAAQILAEPRWLGLTEAHGRLWRRGELAHRRKSGRAGPATRYLEPAVLSRITARLDILAAPRDQACAVEVEGRSVRIAGFDDPQAMRAYLLAMLTGRRINEILLMDYEPIEPLIAADAASGADPDAFVARLRYQQTKIDGAPNRILVEQAVVNIVREQQAWLRDQLAGEGTGQDRAAPPRYLFIAAKRNRQGQRPYSRNTLNHRLGVLARALQLKDSAGAIVEFQKTHALRHTKATELINAGVPLHVVQRYLGHRSPEMTMHYAATLDQTHEREFLRLARVGRDGRPLELDPRDIYDMAQLDRRTDRILPNGVCLLPPAKSCDKGNACARCEFFATDRSHLPDHREQLAATTALIQARKAQHLERTGEPMSEGNVWLAARLAEVRSLQLIIAALERGSDGQVMRATGAPARVAPGHPEPITIDTRRWRRHEPEP